MDLFKEEQLNEHVHLSSLEFFSGIGVWFYCLSQMILASGFSPSWIYPAQRPQGNKDESISGLNWPDMPYAIYLFCVGASISNHYRRSPGLLTFSYTIIYQWVFMVLLALFCGNFQFSPEKDYSSKDYGINILSFGLASCMLFEMRFLSMKWYHIIFTRVLGLVGLIILTFTIHDYPVSHFFSFKNINNELIVLSSSWLFGSAWYFLSRENAMSRVAPIGALVAFRLAAYDLSNSSADNYWTYFAWDNIPIPYVFKIEYLQYLIIVLPASVISDFFLENYVDLEHIELPPLVTHQNWRAALSSVCFFLVAVLGISLAGITPHFLSPESVLTCAIISVLVLCVIRFIFKMAEQQTNSLIVYKKVLYWGIYFWAIGYILVPSEDSIKRHPVQLSYLCYAAGFCILAYLAAFLFTVSGVFSIKQANKWKTFLRAVVQFFILCGENSLLAYGLASWFLPAFLGIVGLRAVPWAYICVGMASLSLICAACSWFKVRWIVQYTVTDHNPL